MDPLGWSLWIRFVMLLSDMERCCVRDGTGGDDRLADGTTQDTSGTGVPESEGFVESADGVAMEGDDDKDILCALVF